MGHVRKGEKGTLFVVGGFDAVDGGAGGDVCGGKL